MIALVDTEYWLGFYAIAVLMHYGPTLIVKIYSLWALIIRARVLIWLLLLRRLSISLILLVANNCKAYGMHASTGILFNHESPLRPERFVIQKIIRGAARIARGELDV